MKKRWMCALLSVIMILATGMTASAADTKIGKARITFNYDGDRPESGSSLGSVIAETESDLFKIDHVEYINDIETWTVGDRPLVRVELSAKEGYRFTSSSRSNFLLSGCSATFKRAQMSDEGKSMELDVYLKRVTGKLTGTELTEWIGNVAEWDSVEGAKRYQVRLYRGTTSVTTIDTTETSYDFTGDMGREGYYSYRVRAIASYDGKEGEWSEYSDELYVDEQAAQKNSLGNKWVQNQQGWWYSYGTGGYPANKWEHIDNTWYYFNQDGYMLTGWQFINNHWYYLNGSGAMVTNWRFINNYWYYMNGDGVMLTDWQLINDRWYYLDQTTGAMYVSTKTPDGYNVDASGALIH